MTRYLTQLIDAPAGDWIHVFARDFLKRGKNEGSVAHLVVRYGEIRGDQGQVIIQENIDVQHSRSPAEGWRPAHPALDSLDRP